jgi:short-chain fatty acids transporter
MPDSFIFATILTFITYIMGMLIADNGPFEMIRHWYNGFWELLEFGMQMVLILVTGHALAGSPLMRSLLNRVAAIPRNPVQAIYLTGFVSCILGLIHWGFGLIGGGILAVYMARSALEKGIRLHYPLLVATAYLPLLIWHNGLSGSAPLLCATPGHFLEAEIGLIPTTQTLLSWSNIIIALGILVICPLAMMLMLPVRENEVITADLKLIEKAIPTGYEEETELSTFSLHLENSRIITLAICIMGFVYLVYYFATNGIALNLNIVNFLFLMMGMAFWKTPIRYVRAVADATKGVSGIILQFPFYAGIMGMMKFSGLVTIIAGWFVAISNQFTYPLWVLISAALVNLFVPSGGGQVAVQGPILVKAGGELGVPISKTIIAFSCGDELTNMVQPFWAIALLGIARLKPKDIFGYCFVIMFFAFIIMALGLLFID